MYIVRWLIGHPIVAVLVLIAVALLVTPKSRSKDISLVDNSDALVVTTKLIKEDKDNKEILAPVTDIAKVTDSKIVKSVKDVKSTIETSAPLKAELAKSIGETTDVSTGVVKKTASKETATMDLGQLTGEEMLLMAREAYWNNGLDEAAQIYKKLIETEPKVLEHRGELGNVYWRQGYPKKAAELYSEIAIPMIEDGGSERVANMIGFIGLFYPDRAAEIHKKIQSKSNRGISNGKE